MVRFSLTSYMFVVFVFCAQRIYGNHFANEESCNRSLVLAIGGVPQLMRFDLQSQVPHVFTPMITLVSPIALATDQQRGLVFFTDVSLSKIYSKDFKTGSDTVVIKDLAPGSKADGMALDPTLRKIVYSDYAEDITGRLLYAYIRSMDYQGNNVTDILTHNDNLHRPRAVLLDTNSRSMYYTDWGTTPHISRAGYTGENVQVLLNSSLIFPNGLTEDFANNKIYYCDAGTDAVGVLNTDGTGQTVLFQNTMLNLHFFDIVRVHDLLYVSNWNGETGVIEMSLQGNNARGFITVEGNFRINGIVDICFPADGISEPFHVDDRLSSTTTSTTTSLSITPKSSDSSDSGEEGLSQTMMIVIGMSLLAIVVIIILIVSATLCCMCRKKSGSQTPESGDTHQQYDNNAFDPPPQYDTPLDVDPKQAPVYVSSADPPYMTSDYLPPVSNVRSGDYEQLHIYQSIRQK